MENPDENEKYLPAALSDPLRILIVEDDKMMAEWVSKNISPIRDVFPAAEITIVHEFDEATHIINLNPPPHAVLLDLGLPKYTWQEVVVKVSEIEERAAVVIITGHKKTDVEALLVDKNVEVLEKEPGLWAPNNIIRAIVRALERRKLAMEKKNFSEVRNMICRLKAHYGPTA